MQLLPDAAAPFPLQRQLRSAAAHVVSLHAAVARCKARWAAHFGAKVGGAVVVSPQALTALDLNSQVPLQTCNGPRVLCMCHLFCGTLICHWMSYAANRWQPT